MKIPTCKLQDKSHPRRPSKYLWNTTGRLTTLYSSPIFRSHNSSLFLAYGADPKIPDVNGIYLFETAALRAPLEFVKLLLPDSASIALGSCALNAAAPRELPDRIPVMVNLLEHSADINGIARDFPESSEARKTGRKETSLHAAAKWGNEQAERWLSS